MNINNNKLMTTIQKVNEYFKLPIYYNKNKVKINENIIKDLELIETVDNSCNPIYEYVFDNDNDISKKLNEQFVEYYTIDVDFLKDSQTLLREYKSLDVKYTDYSKNYKNIVDIWNELKINSGFKEKYYFVEYEMIEFLNRSEWFLQFTSIYNLLSPLISLLVPIIILIIPFIVLKIKGLKISINGYIDILKIVASQNSIGKLFVINFNEINYQEKFYILISAAFYLFSIYQNFIVCMRFNNNMKQIHNHFNEIKIYIGHTINTIENYLKYAINLKTYEEFNQILNKQLTTLKNLEIKISNITDYNMFNFSKIKEIGYILKCFYELHTDEIFNQTIIYSLGFNAYIDCLKGLQNNIVNRKINFTNFINKNNKILLKNSYYACLKNAIPVKNTIKLKNNIIITGPNASGKTTILKSTLINILLSQQFGCGFYETAYLKPYNNIYCYLNIPDTSGRDSLFQAEARRCKEILDNIQKNPKNETHFCAFDELYSGTNPEEAEKSASSFMSYIVKYKNVSSILTTHFIKVCKKLNNNKNIINYKMMTYEKDENLIYTYKLIKGISSIKGGVLILKQLNYPKEIIENV